MNTSPNSTRELSIFGAMVAIAGLALLVVTVEPPAKAVTAGPHAATSAAKAVRDTAPHAAGRIKTVSQSGPAMGKGS